MFGYNMLSQGINVDKICKEWQQQSWHSTASDCVHFNKLSNIINEVWNNIKYLQMTGKLSKLHL